MCRGWWESSFHQQLVSIRWSHFTLWKVLYGKLELLHASIVYKSITWRLLDICIHRSVCIPCLSCNKKSQNLWTNWYIHYRNFMAKHPTCIHLTPQGHKSSYLSDCCTWQLYSVITYVLVVMFWKSAHVHHFRLTVMKVLQWWRWGLKTIR